MTMPRFFVSTNTEHGCCYKAIIRDRNQPASTDNPEHCKFIAEVDTVERAQYICDALNASNKAYAIMLADALRDVIASTHSHVDSHDLLAELHPRDELDIVRREGGQDYQYEGDWLSQLQKAVLRAKRLVHWTNKGEA